MYKLVLRIAVVCLILSALNGYSNADNGLYAYSIIFEKYFVRNDDIFSDSFSIKVNL